MIDAVTQAYSMEYANVHRGLHYLSNLATDKYEAVRGTIARFLKAGSEDEIVFTSGATEGINLVSYGWAAPRLQPGDEIVLSIMEHHANIVPWHFLRERQGVVLKWVEVDANGDLDAQAVIDAAAAGELVPSQAAQIVTALGGVAKIIEATELLKRIEALESLTAAR